MQRFAVVPEAGESAEADLGDRRFSELRAHILKTSLGRELIPVIDTVIDVGKRLVRRQAR